MSHLVKSARWSPSSACWCALVLAASGCAQQTWPDPRPSLEEVAAIRARGGGGAGGAAAAAQPTGTGWGTLKGRFLLAGGAPALDALSTGGKDGQVCGNSVPNQSLVVDSATRGIANVLVYARKVSRVFAEENAAPPAEALFDQKNCVFLSHVMGVKTAQTMLIKNSDPIGHNTNMSPQGNPGINPLLAPGGEVRYQFQRQLTIPAEATCSIHPWMKAYVLARDDGYFAVTAPDGSFEIPNLPAGEDIEFQVWHERAPQGLEAASGWARGRFTKKIGENETLDLGAVEVPVGQFN